VASAAAAHATAWPGPDPTSLLASLSPRTRALLAAPLLVLPLLLAPTAALAAPATPAEMNLYTRIAAVNACISRSAGIDFDKAVGIAGETIAQLILGQHQGLIQQVGTKPLTLDELRKGSINSAVIGAFEICPKQVPPEVAKKVQEALSKKPAQPAPAPK
jgi:hypothetical protein